jgi:hypothetical protein
LIDTLASIIRFGIDIFCAKMSPLETIDRAEITHGAAGKADAVEVFAGSVSIPEFYAGGCEGEGGSRDRDELEEFGDYGAEEDAFCGE